MLSLIREKLKIWIVVILLILVAIPLIFMGLGNYQTAQQSYSLIIDDQVISTTRLEQEVFQYKQALKKSFQGNIPSLYTDNFIRKITLDYMMRSILLDNASKEMGLKYHEKSIVDEIKNTSAFKDEHGFNPKLYKNRIINFGMKPKDYEAYVHQKGISNQLKSAITDTSFLTQQEKSDLANFRFHNRKGNYILISYDEVKKKIKISNEEIQEYYDKHNKDFMTSEKAIFEYIDVDKFDLINSIDINEEILREIYATKLDRGEYFQSSQYKINHILVSKQNNNNHLTIENTAEKAVTELKKGMSFSEAARIFSNDDETKNNEGYLGEFFLEDLPNYLQTKLKNMQRNQISDVIKSDKGFHIVSIQDKTDERYLSFNEVREAIASEYKTEHGTRLFFELVDQISEKSFQNDSSMKTIAETSNLNIKTSKTLSKNVGYGIFNYGHIRRSLFVEDIIKNNYSSDLIYVNDNRFIVGKMKVYFPPEKMTFFEAENSILILLTKQRANSEALSKAKNIRIRLNNENDETLEYKKNNFNLSLNSKDIQNEMKRIFFSVGVTESYQYVKMDNDDYLVYKIDSISYPKNTEKLYKENNEFANFIINTRSESEYNVFHEQLKNNANIKINESYLNLN